MTSKDALPDDKTFILALKQNNLYRKNALCKFLLTAIENQGKEQLITDNLTIEHIMPQNKNLSTAWQKMLGEDVWQSVQEKYLHTLGNLTLTAYHTAIPVILSSLWPLPRIHSRNTYKVSASKFLIPCAINSARFC